MAMSAIMDRQTLETASDGRPARRERGGSEAASQLRMLFVRVLAGRVAVALVPGLFDRAGVVAGLLGARRCGGGLARILLVSSQQLVQPTHEGSLLVCLDTPQIP
jgi:hypothetical protein